MDKKWKDYEEVAIYLLDQFKKEFGLIDVEGKQKISGYRSGTNWEIDAKGINEKGEGFIIIECRRYTTSKQNQEKLGSLAYRIMDTGASGGIIVDPLGLQEGAQKIAKSENIIHVTIDANSTSDQFSMKFLNKIMLGLCEYITMKDEAMVELIRTCTKCGNKFTVHNNEKICPKCNQNNLNESA